MVRSAQRPKPVQGEHMRSAWSSDSAEVIASASQVQEWIPGPTLIFKESSSMLVTLPIKNNKSTVTEHI